MTFFIFDSTTCSVLMNSKDNGYIGISQYNTIATPNGSLIRNPLRALS
jgi:hypothetical protein